MTTNPNPIPVVSSARVVDLDAIEALAANATEGPWRWAYPGSDSPELTGVAGDENYTYETQVLYAEHDGGCGCRKACTMELLIDNEADGEFIAAARTTVPELVAYARDRDAEVARLKAIVDELSGALERVVHYYDCNLNPVSAIGQARNVLAALTTEAQS